MKRRTLLGKAAVGIGLMAGCIGGPNQPGNGSPSPPMGTSSPVPIDENYQIELSVKESTKDGLQLSVSTPVEKVGPDQAGVLSFAITNTGDESMEIRTGPIWPFGILFAKSSGGDQFLLWRDEYEENPNVKIKNGSIAVAQIAYSESIDPDETVTRKYSIRPKTEGVKPGDYRVKNNSEGFYVGSLQYQVNLDLSPAEG